MPNVEQITIRGRNYNLGYRVLTMDLKSLGLKRNPTILQYEIGKWHFLPENQVIPGKGDVGGIWVGRTFGKAMGLRKYMQNHYSQKTRIFRALLDDILYVNDYRVKTNGIKLIEEIFIK